MRFMPHCLSDEVLLERPREAPAVLQNVLTHESPGGEGAAKHLVEIVPVAEWVVVQAVPHQRLSSCSETALGCFVSNIEHARRCMNRKEISHTFRTSNLGFTLLQGAFPTYSFVVSVPSFYPSSLGFIESATTLHASMLIRMHPPKSSSDTPPHSKPWKAGTTSLSHMQIGLGLLQGLEAIVKSTETLKVLQHRRLDHHLDLFWQEPRMFWHMLQSTPK